MNCTPSWSQDGHELPRKDIVKVVLSRQQREILKQIATKLGQSESEIMRTAFMQYAKESLITEKVHGKKRRLHHTMVRHKTGVTAGLSYYKEKE
jgi:hypothetical protein